MSVSMSPQLLCDIYLIISSYLLKFVFDSDNYQNWIATDCTVLARLLAILVSVQIHLILLDGTCLLKFNDLVLTYTLVS